MLRPQSAISVSSKMSEQPSSLRLPEMHLCLRLSVNPRLMGLFPTDPHADITITLQSKQFRLQKAHLRLETKYFDGMVSYEEKQALNSAVYESILHCIYGREYIITKHSEVYFAYQICSFLKIESLLNQIEQSIENDFESFNFLVVYQLAETYNSDVLRQLCIEHLESNSETFKKLLNVSKVKLSLIKTKQLFQQPKVIDQQAPTTLLLLNEPSFKKFLHLHNSYKQVESNLYVSYEDIYEIIRSYVECRIYIKYDYDLYMEIVRSLVIELIDRRLLSSRQYRNIYNQLLYNPDLTNSIMEEPSINPMNETVVKNTRLLAQQPMIEEFRATLTKRNLQVFDPILSENFITKLEVGELRDENMALIKEVQTLKIYLEQSTQHGNSFSQEMGQIKTHFTQLDQRFDQKIGLLQNDLYDVKNQLQQKQRELQEKDENIIRLREQIQQMVNNHSEVVDDINDRQFNDEDEDQKEEGQYQEEDLEQDEEDQLLINQTENYDIDQNLSSTYQDFKVEMMNESESQLYENYSQVPRTQVINDSYTRDIDKSVLSMNSYYVDDELKESVNKQSKFSEKEEVESEFLIQSYLKSTLRPQNISLTVTQKYNTKNKIKNQYNYSQISKLVFNLDPVTLEDTHGLCFLQKQLGVTIFQTIECRQVYIGSRDGYTGRDLLRTCFGISGLLVLMKSFDYDKNFGVYVGAEIGDTEGKEIEDREGFVFSVTHQFIVAFPKKKVLRIDNTRLLSVGKDMVIGNDCCEEGTCTSDYPSSLQAQKNLNYSDLTGGRRFQLEEIEAYEIKISTKMQ